eukprot:CAMPEP_0184872952 /NCGR_PEP_ID=MMETSP0580-20130426/41575_1 /TAXON_ID=1118495 /ORGANISM="Dactyliosolen fragilissimus" /LENGTH=183 /DNA_ID=CAMNT_0027375809 /DNA_START=123 /DNA_END=674 /DNA_ORIENTATION=+
MYDAILKVGLFSGKGDNNYLHDERSYRRQTGKVQPWSELMDKATTAYASSSLSLLEEEYISRVKKKESLVPNDHDDHPDYRFHPKLWTVEATSIQSRLFDDLKSCWKIRQISRKVVLNNSENEGAITPENSNPHDIWCHVDFEVQMTISDPVISSVLDKVLKQVAKQQVNAFQKRCLQLPYTK